MKFFSKFLIAIGIILIFFSVVMLLTKGTMEDTYYQFEERLMEEHRDFDNMTEAEIEKRYEDYLEYNSDMAKAFRLGSFFIGLGFVAAAISIVFLDRAFKKNSAMKFDDGMGRNYHDDYYRKDDSKDTRY